MTRPRALGQLAAVEAVLGTQGNFAGAETNSQAPRPARQRPKLFVFDVIETLFDPSPIDGALTDLGLPNGSFKVWFPCFLRDAFALELVGEFKPFHEIAGASLKVLCEGHGLDPGEKKIAEVLARFATLPAHPDVRAGFEAVRDAGLRIIALTNGNADVTRNMLGNAGLSDFVERSLSIEEVNHWKPAREVYLYAARAMQLEPHQMALIAAHDWDTAGASRAGLTTGGVIRGTTFSAALPPPDVLTNSLPETVTKVLALPVEKA